MEMNLRSMVYPQPLDVPYMKSSELFYENGLPHFGVTPAIKLPSPQGAVSAVARPWTTTTKPKEPPAHGWFGSLQGFNSGGSIPFKTFDMKTSACSNSHEQNTLSVAPASKHFLVFDQTGDKTTLVYSSEIQGTQFHFNSLNSKAPPPPSFEDHSHNSNKRKSEIINEEAPCGWSPDFTSYKVNDEDITGFIQSDSGSEMREDSEEINALLYSDDDGEDSSYYDDEDDEVTSTGHSPPSDEMLDDYKGNEKFANWFDDDHAIEEEVASSFGYPTKRLKTFHDDGGCDGVSLMNNTNSPTTNTKIYIKGPSSENEDDAESACGDSNTDNDLLDVSSGSKEGWREERIREAMGILHSIVPACGKGGKDASSVIEEAIDYLRCLKA